MTGTGLLIRGQRVLVEGLDIYNIHDNSKLFLKIPEDGAPRDRDPTLLVVHSSKGWPDGDSVKPPPAGPGVTTQALLDLPAPGTDGMLQLERLAEVWQGDPRHGGAAIGIAHDGKIACYTDLALDCSYNATQLSVNKRCIGQEYYQGNRGEFTKVQLAAGVLLNRALSRIFSIQAQMHRYAKGDYYREGQPLVRLVRDGLPGNAPVFGLVGHRDVSATRGDGDPGDLIMKSFEDPTTVGLTGLGWETYDFSMNADIPIWAMRQRSYGIAPADGLPGPGTSKAFKDAGFKDGLWWPVGTLPDGNGGPAVPVVAR